MVVPGSIHVRVFVRAGVASVVVNKKILTSDAIDVVDSNHVLNTCVLASRSVGTAATKPSVTAGL